MNEDILERCRQFVGDHLKGDSSGHDWWHIHRVVNNALLIGKAEGADLFIVELGALLHDVGDFKFHGGDETVGPRLVREWLETEDLPSSIMDEICGIVKDISFKGAGNSAASQMKSLEGQVIQDADRLDAMGAIGIARTFAYGGFKGREIYNPDVPPCAHETFEAYKKSVGPTINHFYEKLLLLKDLMNTSTAKKLAMERHVFMQQFLEQFFKEWNLSSLPLGEGHGQAMPLPRTNSYTEPF